MDQKIVNAFDGLLEENEGRDWIVTKFEKGKIKAARCKEDELDDLYITRTDWVSRYIDEEQTNVPQQSEGTVPKWKLHGTAMFLIRDMLNCETKNGYFICKNIPFLDVLICGTVVSLSIRFDKYAIVVDDGTSSIMCIIKQEEFAALKRSEEELQKDRDLIAAFKANPDDPMLKGTMILMRSLQKMDKNVPRFEEMKLGDVVTIFGTLSEYKNNRYVFIKSIETEEEGTIAHITHLSTLLDLYTNHYPKKDQTVF